MDILSAIGGWLSDPIHQLVVPADTISDQGSDVVVRLCSGHSIVLPRNLLRVGTPEDGRQGGYGVTLGLADEVDPAEADFLQRLVAVAVGLATALQATPGDASPAEGRGPISGEAIRFVIHPSALKSSEGDADHLVNLGGGLEIAVPASLVNVERPTTDDSSGQSPGCALAFKQGSPLTPVLNQLVQVIAELIREVS